MKFPSLPTLALVSGSISTTVSAKWLRDGDIPSTGEDWISLASDGSQFQPSPKHRHLFSRDLSSSSKGDGLDAFIYASPDVAYDTYAQAWRFLGYYIDCGNHDDDDHRDDNNNDAGDDGNINKNANCRRNIMWAAYVDPGYAGGGFGEYSFYDVELGTWANSCFNATRCVKHDCHLDSTSFELLGFFKEPANNDDFWEQLFKHEGVCVWPDEVYPFAQSFRENVLPKGCTQLSSGYYYDIKPLTNGEFGIAVYSDAYCMEEYNAGNYSLNNDLYNTLGAFYVDDRRHDDEDNNQKTEMFNFTGYNGDFFDYWNRALDYWRVCQPCRAYHYRANSSIYENYEQDENGEDQYAYEWTCDDDAGYHNVNQCMKFRTKTDMQTATLHEVRAAAQQGTIVGVGTSTAATSGSTESSNERTDSTIKVASLNEKKTRWALLGVSSVLITVCTVLVVHLHRKVQALKNSPLRTPLVS